MAMKQSFSTSEVAAYCHVTADTVRKWAEAGRMRAFKTPGGHRRIRREDLLTFLRENQFPIHEDLAQEGVKVLIVDGDKSAVSAIRRHLGRAEKPVSIEAASDAFDAGYRLAHFQPDIVFLDLRFPGLDGLEACQRIRGEWALPDTHLVVMAPQDDGELLAQAMASGASARLPKPLGPDALRRILARLGVETA